MENIEHKHVEVRGLKLHVAEIGSDPKVVVFLHGFPKYVALANKGYREIAIHFMGYGLADPENDTLIDLVHDVVALLDALAINKAFLIGKDFGALLAYLVTAIHPERISGVVTLGIPFTLPSPFVDSTYQGGRNLRTKQESRKVGKYAERVGTGALVHLSVVLEYLTAEITPDSATNFTLNNRLGRVFYNHSFTLWEDSGSSSSDPAVNGSHVASFSLSLLISVFYPNSSTIPNEGLSFLIAPDMTLSVTSHDQYLGLPDVTTDEDPNNHLLAVDLSDDSAFAIKWAIQNYLCPSDVVIFLHVRPTNGLYGGLGSHRRLHLTTSQVLGLSGTF
ncbi:hypothetical protein DVH24_023865 [Malus domestica]|uniref:AB hydrolase-1 domain-containing protein n=1 Tax=Malus domestica TaxID=3750 RepID=A0A498JLI0_MALDO|nr:hypothetical protein DVH24_023865 [Malus domestica]